MKYVSPKYNSEVVNTSDIICESPYTIVHTKDKVFNEATGEMDTVNVTQISVDASKLF